MTIMLFVTGGILVVGAIAVMWWGFFSGVGDIRKL